MLSLPLLLLLLLLLSSPDSLPLPLPMLPPFGMSRLMMRNVSLTLGIPLTLPCSLYPAHVFLVRAERVCGDFPTSRS